MNRPSKGEWEGKPSKGKLLEGRGLGVTVPRRGNRKLGPSKGWRVIFVFAGFTFRLAEQAAASASSESACDACARALARLARRAMTHRDSFVALAL